MRTRHILGEPHQPCGCTNQVRFLHFATTCSWNAEQCLQIRRVTSRRVQVFPVWGRKLCPRNHCLHESGGAFPKLGRDSIAGLRTSHMCCETRVVQTRQVHRVLRTAFRAEMTRPLCTTAAATACAARRSFDTDGASERRLGDTDAVSCPDWRCMDRPTRDMGDVALVRPFTGLCDRKPDELGVDTSTRGRTGDRGLAPSSTWGLDAVRVGDMSSSSG